MLIHQTHLPNLVKAGHLIWYNVFKFILENHTFATMITTHILGIIIILFSHHLDDVLHDNESNTSNRDVRFAFFGFKSFGNLTLSFILFFYTWFDLFTQSLNLLVSEAFFFNDFRPFFRAKKQLKVIHCWLESDNYCLNLVNLFGLFVNLRSKIARFSTRNLLDKIFHFMKDITLFIKFENQIWIRI